ncbi:amidohydrolase family protein [Candidatus Woesearchaeota archaeon]|nr:amidohydrolase family protein [Candidatus Woesearchaeota archaeon]MBW3022188.1 amidohydrolase family protein [Candidatus Woesearchaeota archaeon]
MSYPRVDGHVHFRDREQNYKETIVHGLETATKAGVTYVIDMPNLREPILREPDVKARLSLVPEDQAYRYFLYVGATADPKQLEEALWLAEEHPQVVGVKVYTCKSVGDLKNPTEESQRLVFRKAAEANYKGVIAVHCEEESLISYRYISSEPYSHAQARPKIAEITSAGNVIRYGNEEGFEGTIHICHVTCPEVVEIVDRARSERNITCATTPLYLKWTDEKLRGEHGAIYKTNPPLRSKEDRTGLRIALLENRIDWIETDHAPHTIGEKLFDGHPSGFPTLYIYREVIEELLPNLGATPQQIKAWTLDNIVKTFNLPIDQNA